MQLGENQPYELCCDISTLKVMGITIGDPLYTELFLNKHNHLLIFCLRSFVLHLC